MPIQRIVPADEMRREAVQNFDRHVKQQIAARAKTLETRAKQLAIAHAPVSALIQNDARATVALQELTPQVEAERQRMRTLTRALHPRRGPQLSLTPLRGLTVGIPPYDVTWSTGVLPNRVDQNKGTFECSSIDTLGLEGAGLGVFITSPVSTNLRFSADVFFHTNWVDWPLAPHVVALSEGGVGVLVSRGSNVVHDQRQVLWADTDFNPGEKHGDEEWFYLTQTSLGQTYFPADAGATYLVWVWAYVWTGLLGEQGFSIGHIDADMPFIVVEEM